MFCVFLCCISLLFYASFLCSLSHSSMLLMLLSCLILFYPFLSFRLVAHASTITISHPRFLYLFLCLFHSLLPMLPSIPTSVFSVSLSMQSSFSLSLISLPPLDTHSFPCSHVRHHQPPSPQQTNNNTNQTCFH